ncbi:MAG: diguanylate cyclase, partial [Planctomycetota bacterium]|nr:diguanylate cyclase [Planctomycetota bacterium]
MSGAGSLEMTTGGLRVIIVGAASLEAALRRDPGIELIRANGPVDAIAELALPIDDESPAATAVVIERRRLESSEAREFAEAARSIDPAAKLIVVSERGGEDGSAFFEVFDATAPAESDAADLRALLEALTEVGSLEPADVAVRDEEEEHETAAIDEPAAVEAREEAPAMSVAAPVGSLEKESLDAEAAIIDRLLRGDEIMAACIACLRERMGGEVVFEEGEGADGAAVERRGRRFGSLRCDGADAEALAVGAAWLANWLALAEQQRQLREAAFTDSLTGAWNRRYADRFLASAIENARRKRHDLTVLLFDIDDFKQYNDRFGHGAGDQILRETVRLMKSVIRPTDRVCRMGGDEFAVIFDEPEGPRTPNSRHPISISEIAARFQKQVCEHRFPKLGEEAQATLTISGGIATFPWDGHDAASLLERADQL